MKWSTFHRHLFHMHFLVWKFINFESNFTKCVPKGPVDNKTALVQIMAWRRTDDKPLSKPEMTYFGEAYIDKIFITCCMEKLSFWLLVSPVVTITSQWLYFYFSEYTVAGWKLFRSQVFDNTFRFWLVRLTHLISSVKCYTQYQISPLPIWYDNLYTMSYP